MIIGAWHWLSHHVSPCNGITLLKTKIESQLQQNTVFLNEIITVKRHFLTIVSRMAVDGCPSSIVREGKMAEFKL